MSTIRPSARPPEFSRAYSGYVLSVLFVVYVFNFIDRQILAMLLDPIKAEIQVSDTLMGVLIGPTFVFFYTFAGIPIARWADRGSRTQVIVLAVAIWSAMTVACGFARSFTQLALARFGVGIGEAGGTPPSHSILTDYFPPERRATALSIYAQGIYVGAMFAYLAGGYVQQHFDWRTAFIAVGLPGLALALLVRFTVREPTRGYWETAAPQPAVSFADVARHLFSMPSFLWLLAAASCQAVLGYGYLYWIPDFLGRVHGMSGVEIGTWLGLIVGLGGSAGAFLGGFVGDRLGAHDARWYVFLSALISVAAFPFALPFLLLDDARPALLFFVPCYLIGAMYVGPLWSMTQSLARPAMRATASALLLFILNIAGLGLGVPLVGFLNDQLAPELGVEAIRYSLLVVAAIGVLAAPCFWIASRTLREDLARVHV